MTIETLQIEVDGMSIGNWTVADAKARFSELIEQAQSKGPQTITKHGRTAAVVVSAEEWERKTKRKGNLAEFFATSQRRDSGVENQGKIGRTSCRESADWEGEIKVGAVS